MNARPDPEDALDRVAQAFVEQARRGEMPSVEAFADAHPELADDIRELFPVLALVEGVKVDTPASGPATAEGSSASETPHDPLPRRIGPYAIIREIGRGGMGRVYEARGTEGRVAVKVVHPHLLDNPEFVARALREAEVGRRVEHPGVVRTLDTGLVDGKDGETPYLVLEYVEGQNLRDLLREVEVVPERLCRHVAASVAEALAAVHAAGLVHRDVKPENIVITRDESVKLMDLGVAVVQEGALRLSQTGDFVGSILYAAPDQIAGGRPTPQWDLYALGVTIRELATGAHPARGEGLQWLRAKTSASTRPTQEQLSPFLGAVIDALVAPDPDPDLGDAETLCHVLRKGEASSWWRTRGDRAPTATTRLQRLERSTAFFGRKKEWRTLDHALAEAQRGQGRAVLIEGDAGIGKTRLVHEWLAAQRATDAAPRLIVVPHDPGIHASNEERFVAGLAEQFGAAHLEARLVELLGSRAPLAPALSRRLRGEQADADAGSLDAAYLALAHALAQDRGLVILFEDLHFGSEEDVERFLFLAGGVGDDPVLVIGTQRPGGGVKVDTSWLELPRTTHLMLEGLEQDACRSLVQQASTSAVHVAESVTDIIERSDRNPLFLLELVHEHDRRKAMTGVDTAAVPRSVRDLIVARLGALEPEDRELLEAAACAGNEFDPLVVADAAQMGRIQALKRFGRFERARGLLCAAGRFYTFRHHLVQEVLYDDLHDTLRALYHAALGRALEAAAGTSGGARAVLLADHFLRGDLPEAAAPHVRAALEYLDWDNHEFGRSADLAARALENPEALDDEVRAFVMEVHGRALVAAGAFDEARPVLEEAIRLAHETSNIEVEIDARHRLSWLNMREGRLDEALAELQEVVALAQAAGDEGREAVALGRIADTYRRLGRPEEAERHIARAFEALEGSDDLFARARILSDKGAQALYAGRRDEARAAFREAETLAHSVGDVPTEFVLASERGRLAFSEGRFQEAHDSAHRAVDLGRQLGMRHMETTLLSNMARCLVRLGRLEEARARADAAVALGDRLPRSPERMTAHLSRIAVRIASGALDAALQDIAPLLAEPDRPRTPNAPLDVARLHARLLGLLGRHAEAAQALDAAEAAVNERTPISLRAGLAAQRGQLLEQQERWDEALRQHTAAAALAVDAPSGAALHALGRGRALREAGRTEEAASALEEALAWGQAKGHVAHAVLAQVLLASLPGGDPLVARVALESHEEALPVADRVVAHHALWKATHDPADLAGAWRALKTLRDGAPAADRKTLISKVFPHREVAEAAGRARS